MANLLKGHSWIIDTAGASALKAGTTFVRTIRLTGYTAANDTAVIQSENGVIATLKGTADLNPVTVDIYGPVRGLRVTSLTANAEVVIDID